MTIESLQEFSPMISCELQMIAVLAHSSRPTTVPLPFNHLPLFHKRLLLHLPNTHIPHPSLLPGMQFSPGSQCRVQRKDTSARVGNDGTLSYKVDNAHILIPPHTTPIILRFEVLYQQFLSYLMLYLRHPLFKKQLQQLSISSNSYTTIYPSAKKPQDN